MSRLERPFRTVVRRAGIPSPRLLFNISGSLTGAMLVTSALGAAFWWAAARLFTPQAVGLAAGSVSAMTFLGAIAVLGTGSLLLRELPRHPGEEASFISTAMVVTAVGATVLAVAFALLAPAVNPELSLLFTGAAAVALFVGGVILTTAGTVIDHALLGLLHAPTQLLRNVIFAVSKLIFLAPAALIVAADSGSVIFAVWAAGGLLSVAIVWAIYREQVRSDFSIRVLREFTPSALLHFALNTALVLPALVMPVLVALLSPPIAAAQFYVGWMLASVAFYAPVALAQSLYAMGGREVSRLWQHARTTIALSLITGTVALILSVLLAEPVLSLFGVVYAQAAGAVPVLVAVAIPLAIKDHYQIISRIRGRPGQAAILCGVGGAIEIGAGTIGLLSAGSLGLAIGWLAAVTLEALIMAPMAVRAARIPVAEP